MYDEDGKVKRKQQCAVLIFGSNRDDVTILMIDTQGGCSFTMLVD